MSRKSVNSQTNVMSFKEAIDMGEYDPKYLANYPEWHSFSQHVQLQYIRKALDIRRKQLLTQYAEINNVIDFRLKPEMKKALDNIMEQVDKLENDREKLLYEYTTNFD